MNKESLLRIVCLLWLCMAGACARPLAIETVPAGSSAKLESTKPNSGYSGYLRRANNDRVIVFVHGVLGDAHNTWTASNGVFWPELMTHDAAFNGFDIYVYDYPSPLFSVSHTIDELSDNLRLILENEKVFQDHRQVIFICHSMGGLVVRAFLLKYQKLASQVPMIYFYSTPTTGSELASLVRVLTHKNPQFADLVPWRGNAYVGNLVRQWLAAGFSIKSYCAYETQKTYGVKVVEEQSATNLCNQRLDPIDANHIEIVKPDSTSDVPYIAFKQAISELTASKGLVPQGRPTPPDAPAPGPLQDLSPPSGTTTPPVAAESAELEIIDNNGTRILLSNPAIAYSGGFGPSRFADGIKVRRGVEETTLLWSRLRLLKVRSTQEKNEKGKTVWRHAVEATLANGEVVNVELQDDWNMLYMGGGGTGLLFGKTDLGDVSIPFSQIASIRVRIPEDAAMPAGEMADLTGLWAVTINYLTWNVDLRRNEAKEEAGDNPVYCGWVTAEENNKDVRREICATKKIALSVLRLNNLGSSIISCEAPFKSEKTMEGKCVLKEVPLRSAIQVFPMDYTVTFKATLLRR